MTRTFNLYEAKTQLSSLVEDAARGEEITISKNGVPKARLVPIPLPGKRREPVNALGVTWVADDFDAPDPEVERLFEGK